MSESQIIVMISIWIIFLLGFCCGQWLAEKEIRKDREKLGQERMIVSMPMNKDDAQAALELLSEIVKKIESERNNG